MATGGTGDVLAGHHRRAARARARRVAAAAARRSTSTAAAGDVRGRAAGPGIDAGGRRGRRAAPSVAARLPGARACRSAGRRSSAGGDRGGRRERLGAASAAARSCCSRASSARARPRSCAAWPAALGVDPERGREPDLRAAHRLPGPPHAAPRRPLPAGGRRRRPRAGARGAARRRAACWPSNGRSGCRDVPWPRVVRVRLEHAGEDRRRVRDRGGGVKARCLASRRWRSPWRCPRPRPGARRTPRPRPPAAAGNRLNVLLITIDTLRADHLGALRLRAATPARASTPWRARAPSSSRPTRTGPRRAAASWRC